MNVPDWLLEPEDKITILWGKFGQVEGKVSRVTKSGIYACRWNKKRGCWTSPRKIEPYRGIYRIV